MVKYGIGQNNQINSILSVRNVKVLDNYYINPGLLSIFIQSVYLDKKSADFRIQFHAKTKDNNIRGIRYVNLKISL